MSRPDPPPARFIADCMLGRLAKWLRILGFDCRYERAASDEEIVRIAGEEQRTILTRDSRLVERRAARPFLLIESGDPDRQVRQVVTALGLRLDATHLLSRCLRCNERLQPADRQEAAGRVPPFVAATQDAFARCPGCDRIYWGATHRADILRRIERVFGPGRVGDPDTRR